MQKYRQGDITVAEAFAELNARSDPLAWLDKSGATGEGNQETSTFTTENGLTFEIIK